MKYVIDATNKKIGRVASEAASVLLGKNTATFSKNEIVPVTVEVVNAAKLAITTKKAKSFEYTRYSGYPGGLTIETMEHLIGRKGIRAIIESAVKGMLPKNKIQDARLKNLKVTE
jgi:large subunit ribosomal protein L13